MNTHPCTPVHLHYILMSAFCTLIRFARDIPRLLYPHSDLIVIFSGKRQNFQKNTLNYKTTQAVDMFMGNFLSRFAFQLASLDSLERCQDYKSVNVLFMKINYNFKKPWAIRFATIFADLRNCLEFEVSGGFSTKAVSILIISMTKLLDADWLRGVQLFH